MPPGSRPGYNPTLGACSGPRLAQALLYGVGPICAPWDSIPATDHPRFLRASKVGFVRADEPVITVDRRGSDRAYPVQILAYHEIVNDVVGGRPIAVTFCPLCNSGVAFSRRVGGRTLTFAVTGQLNFANLVMFDRQTVSQWRQLEGVAISGPFKGTRLKLVPAQMVSFGEWRAAHPNGLVMRRPPSPFHYGVDPYHGTTPIPPNPAWWPAASPSTHACRQSGVWSVSRRTGGQWRSLPRCAARGQKSRPPGWVTCIWWPSSGTASHSRR